MNSLRSYAIQALVAAGSLILVMGTPALPQALSGTLKKVQESKKFVIGYREASFPFAYYDDAKKPVGFAVELCTRIGEAGEEGAESARDRDSISSGKCPDADPSSHEWDH